MRSYEGEGSRIGESIVREEVASVQAEFTEVVRRSKELLERDRGDLETESEVDFEEKRTMNRE